MIVLSFIAGVSVGISVTLITLIAWSMKHKK